MYIVAEERNTALFLEAYKILCNRHINEMFSCAQKGYFCPVTHIRKHLVFECFLNKLIHVALRSETHWWPLLRDTGFQSEPDCWEDLPSVFYLIGGWQKFYFHNVRNFISGTQQKKGQVWKGFCPIKYKDYLMDDLSLTKAWNVNFVVVNMI